MSLMMGGDAGISAFPDGDNIFLWTGTMTGGVGTIYEGLSYKLSLKFPTSYPYEPPQITFVTPCFHPNVDQYGNICLDILKVGTHIAGITMCYCLCGLRKSGLLCTTSRPY